VLRISHLLLLFAAYLGVVVVLTWPLAPSAATHLPCPSAACTYDPFYSAWVLAYESHALATAPGALADANIYHPTPNALFYGPAGFGTLPYFAPLFLATGAPALALNVTLLVCIALSATALHAVIVLWTGSHAAGLFAAATLLVNRWVLWGFIGATPHLASLQYFPLIVLLAARRLERAAGMLALLVLIVLQCLTDTVYVALAVLAPLAVLAAARVARPAWRASGYRLLGVLALAVLAMIPVYAGYLGVRAANPLLAAQTVWPPFEPPFDLSGLFWKLGPPLGPPTTVGPTAVAVIVIGGALALARRRGGIAVREGWLHGALWTVVGTLLSLTPVALFLGRAVTLPHAWLDQWTPFYRIIRAPTRLGVAALIGLCLLAGVAFAEITRRPSGAPARGPLQRLWRALALLAVLLSSYLVAPGGAGPLPRPFPITPVPSVPAAFLAELVADDGPLLQLPALEPGKGRPGKAWNARAMLQSTAHWRPLLNGYSSYWPAGFIERMQLGEQLPDRGALERLVRETGVRMVWVDLASVTTEQRARWQAAPEEIEQGGLRLVARDGANLLFRVVPAAAARPQEEIFPNR